MVRCILRALLVVIGLSNLLLASEVTIQFVARGMHPKRLHDVVGTPDEQHAVSLGHVFMIIEIPTRQGIKEEVFGFYPRKNSIAGIIKGPGMLRAEARCGPEDDCNPSVYKLRLKQYSESEQSATVSVDSADLPKVFEEVNAWNMKQYSLTKDNCIGFVDSVVRKLGFPSPERTALTTPTEYVVRLRRTIEQEVERRRQERAKKQQDEAQARNQARISRIVGNWTDNVGVQFSVSPNGTTLMFTGGNRLPGQGFFTGDFTFQMNWPQFGTFTGTISADGRKINWNNGVVWTR